MNSRYVLLWIVKADRDVKAAEHELAYGEEMVIEHLGFSCQQAVEKYLKAFLVAKNVVFPRTHDLELLAGLCASVDSEFESLNFHHLGSYAVEERYPFARSRIVEQPSDMRKYVEMAKSVGEMVKHKLGITSGG